MGAYISDTTLYECQRLLAHHYLYFRTGWNNVPETKQLADALDEVDAGISGQPIEEVRRLRIEQEQKESESLLTCEPAGEPIGIAKQIATGVDVKEWK